MVERRITPLRRLTEAQMAVLLEGFDFFNEFKTESEKEMSYRQNRDLVLARWREQHELFTRPSGWWLYECPHELRKRMGGSGTPFPIQNWATDTYWGKPKRYGSDYVVKDSPTYESERDYLIRHPELLTAFERRELSNVVHTAPADPAIH